MSSKWEKVLPTGFEPHKSVATALKIFAAARVPFALVGRIALWFYLPGHQQEYTKDVDFAVPYGYSEQAAQVAREMGYKVEKLSLGYGISGAGVLLDFIDHHPAFEILYLDAVKSARRHGGLPIVSKLHLATMKLGAGRVKDDVDIQRLLVCAIKSRKQYDKLRKMTIEYLGPAAAFRLDRLAREVGHCGPKEEERG